MLGVSLQGDGVVEQQARDPEGRREAQGQQQEGGGHHKGEDVDGRVQRQDGQPQLGLGRPRQAGDAPGGGKHLLLGLAGAGRHLVRPYRQAQHLRRCTDRQGSMSAPEFASRSMPQEEQTLTAGDQ